MRRDPHRGEGIIEGEGVEMSVQVEWGTLMGLVQHAIDDPTVKGVIIKARHELERLYKLEEVAVRLSVDLLTPGGAFSLLDAQEILSLAGEEVMEYPHTRSLQDNLRTNFTACNK